MNTSFKLKPKSLITIAQKSSMLHHVIEENECVSCVCAFKASKLFTDCEMHADCHLENEDFASHFAVHLLFS